MIAAVPYSNGYTGVLVDPEFCPAPNGSYIEVDDVPGFTGDDTLLISGGQIFPGEFYYTDKCNKCQCISGENLTCTDDVSYQDQEVLCISHVCMSGDIVDVDFRDACDCAEDENVEVVSFPDCCICEKKKSATTVIVDTPKTSAVIETTTARTSSECQAPDDSYVELDGVPGFTDGDIKILSRGSIEPGEYYYTGPCNRCKCISGNDVECTSNFSFQDPSKTCLSFVCDWGSPMAKDGTERCHCKEDENVKVVSHPDCCTCEKKQSATTEIVDTSEHTTVIDYSTKFSIASTLPSTPENVDPCSSKPCQNRGVCIPGSENTFSCRCRCRFTGPKCETEKNPCNPDPCLNGGTCTPGSGTRFTYTCSCPSGFEGSRCETERNPCLSNPCQNGGTCHAELAHEYFCNCPRGYTDLRCETERNSCLSNPCLNGGTCELLPDATYICHCPSSYYDTHCVPYEES